MPVEGAGGGGEVAPRLELRYLVLVVFSYRSHLLMVHRRRRRHRRLPRRLDLGLAVLLELLLLLEGHLQHVLVHLGDLLRRVDLRSTLAMCLLRQGHMPRRRRPRGTSATSGRRSPRGRSGLGLLQCLRLLLGLGLRRRQLDLALLDLLGLRRRLRAQRLELELGEGQVAPVLLSLLRRRRLCCEVIRLAAAVVVGPPPQLRRVRRAHRGELPVDLLLHRES